MKRAKTNKYRRVKVFGLALGCLVAGVVLLVLSRRMLPADTPAFAATAPATTAPSGPGEPAERRPAASPEKAAARTLAGFLLLFSTMGFGVAVISVGWLIYDVRRSRPAWKTQKKYPIRR